MVIGSSMEVSKGIRSGGRGSCQAVCARGSAGASPSRPRLPDQRLAALEQIRRPERRRVEQVVVLAGRKRRHLLEQRPLAEGDGAGTVALQQKCAVLHWHAERVHPRRLVPALRYLLELRS